MDSSNISLKHILVALISVPSFKHLFTFITLLAFSFAVDSSAYAATRTWAGGSGTNVTQYRDWTRAGNWSGSTVPTSTDDVVIPTTTYSPYLYDGNSADCRNLTINASATLYLQNNSGSLNMTGSLSNSGTITHTGTIYIYMEGSGKTIGGSGNFFGGSASPFNFAAGASYTLSSSLNVRHVYVEPTASLDMNGYDITTEFFFQEGLLYLRAGNLNIWGNPDASMWYNAGDDLNPYFSTDGNFVPGTGTVFYCQGGSYASSNQTVRTTTYYNLKINTQSTRTTTVGTSGTITVTNNMTFQNSSTAGGVATLAANVTVGGNLSIGATGNALTLNLPYRLYRASGTGTFSMANVAAHAINITYAHATNLCITGFGTPTFYGTVTYNSASAQMVTGATYGNLTFSGAGTKSLAAAIDVDQVMTLSAGVLDVVSGSNYAINLAGDFVRASGATFAGRSGTFTFDGATTQRINVTAAAGTTPTNSDITFYNVVINGSDVIFYYDKANVRKFNMTNFTINSGKSSDFRGN